MLKRVYFKLSIVFLWLLLIFSLFVAIYNGYGIWATKGKMSNFLVQVIPSIIFVILFTLSTIIYNFFENKFKIVCKNKILDSSVIIDGRIIDIMSADFLEGFMIIPSFVLRELQKLADSENAIKRAKGRRALDLIKFMQNNKSFNIYIDEKDYTNVEDVDSKIINLAKEREAYVVTTDYNLNKVATIHGIKVLNINKLSNALKAVVLPNEEIEVDLIKKGDKDGQAIGYLEDGTMVVAENGSSYVGDRVVLIVTSMYPTSAGRMIFGKVRN